jgi:glucokinase
VVKASPVLLADIGGTHSRFALLASSTRPEQVVSWSNDGFDSLEAAIACYLADVGEKPKAGMFAVAGPIIGRAIALTNRDWQFDLDDLGGRFGFSYTDAINDFEAQAWALGLLQEDDYRSIGNNARAQPRAGVKVVLGPGTGLGVAALVPVGDGWQAVATEGGHVSFGAASQDEEPIFALLHKEGPVSAEMVISGSGLPRLHGAVNPDATPLASAEIVGGRFAGDVALTFKAVGGVYIAGGVTGKLGALLDEDIFRTAFEAHPPYGELLQAVPTYLVTVAHPGLIGCAACARAHVNR